MDGDRKKRKLDVVVEEEEEEESEEAKIEKFYELIRSSKDIKTRLMIMQGERAREEEEKRKKANENKRTGAWNPTFQPEDFMEDGKLPVPLGTKNEAAPRFNSKREDDRRHDNGDDGSLNLKLSL